MLYNLQERAIKLQCYITCKGELSKIGVHVRPGLSIPFVPSLLMSTEPKNGSHDFILGTKNMNYHLLKYTVHISAYKDPIILKNIFVLRGIIARYS